MIELKLKGYKKTFSLRNLDVSHTKKPVIFYLINKHDSRRFFITFIIADLIKNELQYLFSYSEENRRKIDLLPNNKIFSISKTPHCTLSINKGEDFLTFMEDEEFFFYVNYKKMVMKVYTMNDVIKDSNIEYRRISSTFYKDDNDPNYFYLSSVDSANLLHIFRISLNLEKVEEIDVFSSNPFPPHVLKKYKDYIFLSHEFKYSRYDLQKSDKIVNSEELARIYEKLKIRLLYKEPNMSNFLSLESSRELFKQMNEKYSIKCMTGYILLLDTKTKERSYYSTSGGSPAHFEIDYLNDTIYTSSHNFLAAINDLVYLEPAVIDKFKLVGGKLEFQGAFSYPKGFRYTSHKIFYFENKPYICMFGQPNRLVFVDAEKMELLFYYDVGEDELSSHEDVRAYLLSRANDFVFIAIEVNAEGNIIFVGPQHIYFFDFSRRELYEQIDYKSLEVLDDEIQIDDYKLITSHLNYLD